VSFDSEHARISKEIQLHPEPTSWDEGTRAHLAHCARCRAAVESFQTVRERLQGLPSARERAPQELSLWLQEELGKSARESPGEASRGGSKGDARPSAVGPLWRWKWLVPGAALAAGILLGFVLARAPLHLPARGNEVPVTVRDYLRDVTHDGYLIAQLQRPLELQSHDAREASRWLEGGLPFTPRLGGAPPGWQLEGARIWHTVSRLSALVEYRNGQGAVVLLFAVPAAQVDFAKAKVHPTPQGPVYEGRGWGYQGLAWRSGDLAWSAVSTLPIPTLLDWLAAYRSGL